MPRIAGVSTVVPDYRLPQAQARALAYETFKDTPGIDLLLSVFDNSMIDYRYFAKPIEWYLQPHTFTETNDVYIQSALDLSQRAVEEVCGQAGIAIRDIDVVIFVSTTGLSTPSIDARLFNILPFDKHIKRMPLWGLGCAGGAGGIARAFDYANAYPDAKVLVIAVEFCSLAFQPKNQTKSNVIATALFGDGVAACLVTGDKVHTGGPNILGSLSTIYPDSLDVMGWRITGEGFHVVLSKDIPSIIRSLVKENILELAQAHELDLHDIKHFVAHPGGKKVLEAICEALGITDHDLRHSSGVLRDYGNMSSVTVYFILQRFLEESPKQGEYGLISALGPGFSSELVLVQW